MKRLMIILLKSILRVVFLITSKIKYHFIDAQKFEAARIVLGSLVGEINPDYKKIVVYECYNASWNQYLLHLTKIGNKFGYFVIIINNNDKTRRPNRVELPDVIDGCLMFDTFNIGRDFGARKLAWKILLDNSSRELEQIVFINDSTVILRPEYLFEVFSSKIDEIIFTSMPSHPKPHPQSFIWALPRKMMTNSEVKKLLDLYMPLSNRWWAIAKGEIALGKKIIKIGFKESCTVSFLFNDDLSSFDMKNLNKFKRKKLNVFDSFDVFDNSENAIDYVNFCVEVNKTPICFKKEHASFSPGHKHILLSMPLEKPVRDELLNVFATRRPLSYVDRIKRSLEMQA